MNLIRNKFVHQNEMIHSKEEKLNDLINIIQKYDIEIKKDKIILGTNVITKYIEHLEEISFEVAKILYVDESSVKRFLEKYPQSQNIFEGMKF